MVAAAVADIDFADVAIVIVAVVASTGKLRFSPPSHPRRRLSNQEE